MNNGFVNEQIAITWLARRLLKECHSDIDRNIWNNIRCDIDVN